MVIVWLYKPTTGEWKWNLGIGYLVSVSLTEEEMEETIVIGVALDVLREVIDYQDLTITVLNDDISPIIESFRTVVSLN